MANKWLDYIFQETDYRESERLVAIALADSANRQGTCFLKMETLAAKAGVSVRQTQRVVRNFEGDGFLTVKRGCVRGAKSEFQLFRVTTATPYQDRLRVTTATNKGDNGDKFRVTTATSPPTPPYKDISLIEPSDEPLRRENPHQRAESFSPVLSLVPDERDERLRFFPNLERTPLPIETLNELVELFSYIAEQQNRKTLIKESEWLDLCRKLFEEGMSPKGIKSLYRYCKEVCGKEIVTPKVMDWKFADYKEFVEKQSAMRLAPKTEIKPFDPNCIRIEKSRLPAGY